MIFFFFQAEDGIRDKLVTGVQTCALPISVRRAQGVRVRQGGPGVRDQRDDGAQDGGVPPFVLRGQGIRKEGGRGMADERLCWLPATELAAAIRRKRVSPVEVVDAILDRVERSEERRVGKSVDLGGRRIIKKKKEKM